MKCLSRTIVLSILVSFFSAPCLGMQGGWGFDYNNTGKSWYDDERTSTGGYWYGGSPYRRNRTNGGSSTSTASSSSTSKTTVPDSIEKEKTEKDKKPAPEKPVQEKPVQEKPAQKKDPAPKKTKPQVKNKPSINTLNKNDKLKEYHQKLFKDQFKDKFNSSGIGDQSQGGYNTSLSARIQNINGLNPITKPSSTSTSTWDDWGISSSLNNFTSWVGNMTGNNTDTSINNSDSEPTSDSSSEKPDTSESRGWRNFDPFTEPFVDHELIADFKREAKELLKTDASKLSRPVQKKSAPVKNNAPIKTTNGTPANKKPINNFGSMKNYNKQLFSLIGQQTQFNKVNSFTATMALTTHPIYTSSPNKIAPILTVLRQKTKMESKAAIGKIIDTMVANAIIQNRLKKYTVPTAQNTTTNTPGSFCCAKKCMCFPNPFPAVIYIVDCIGDGVSDAYSGAKKALGFGDSPRPPDMVMVSVHDKPCDAVGTAMPTSANALNNQPFVSTTPHQLHRNNSNQDDSSKPCLDSKGGFHLVQENQDITEERFQKYREDFGKDHKDQAVKLVVQVPVQQPTIPQTPVRIPVQQKQVQPIPVQPTPNQQNLIQEKPTQQNPTPTSPVQQKITNTLNIDGNSLPLNPQMLDLLNQKPKFNQLNTLNFNTPLITNTPKQTVEQKAVQVSPIQQNQAPQNPVQILHNTTPVTPKPPVSNTAQTETTNTMNNSGKLQINNKNPLSYGNQKLQFATKEFLPVGNSKSPLVIRTPKNNASFPQSLASAQDIVPTITTNTTNGFSANVTFDDTWTNLNTSHNWNSWEGYNNPDSSSGENNVENGHEISADSFTSHSSGTPQANDPDVVHCNENLEKHRNKDSLGRRIFKFVTPGISKFTSEVFTEAGVSAAIDPVVTRLLGKTKYQLLKMPYTIVAHTEVSKKPFDDLLSCSVSKLCYGFGANKIQDGMDNILTTGFEKIEHKLFDSPEIDRLILGKNVPKHNVSMVMPRIAFAPTYREKKWYDDVLKQAAPWITDITTELIIDTGIAFVSAPIAGFMMAKKIGTPIYYIATATIGRGIFHGCGIDKLQDKIKKGLAHRFELAGYDLPDSETELPGLANLGFKAFIKKSLNIPTPLGKDHIIKLRKFIPKGKCNIL